MPVTLTTSRHLPRDDRFDRWCAIGDARHDLDPARRIADLTTLLEDAYEDVAEAWLTLAREMAEEGTASLAHTPAAAGYVSDFGLMLAWTRLAEIWTAEVRTTLLVCDDPWLFRHLKETVPGLSVASPSPALLIRETWLSVRGFAARTRAGFRFLRKHTRWRDHRHRCPREAPSILVYGHPDSDSSGKDAYFGNLLRSVPGLQRILHVDTHGETARNLCEDERTFSIHAWGSPLAALSLPFRRWHPGTLARAGRYRWLVRRAAVREGGTGQAAAIGWQQVCQTVWLRQAGPCVVVWPWENHAWERTLSRAARKLGITTIGYQHATVGRQEWNYSPLSNPDPDRSIPDRIICAGPVSLEALVKMGHRREKLATAGFLRGGDGSVGSYDPEGPVLVALPFDREIARQMLDAIEPVARGGRRFLVKPHPMAEVPRPDHVNVTVIDGVSAGQTALSVVLYAATSLGLEAAVTGLPVVRFRADGKISQDVMPASLPVPTATADTLAAALDRAVPLRGVSRDDVFSKPDMGLWRDIFAAAG